MGFLLRCNCVHTTIWMHYIDTNKTHREKAKCELCLEQILEATLHKKAAVRPLTTHPSNHSSKTNKTYGTLLEKQGRIHKRRSSMNSYTWMCQCWPTSKNLHQLCAYSRCNLEDLPGTIDGRNEWWECIRELRAASATR